MQDEQKYKKPRPETTGRGIIPVVPPELPQKRSLLSRCNVRNTSCLLRCIRHITYCRRILLGRCSGVLFAQTLICGSHHARTLWERISVLLVSVTAFIGWCYYITFFCGCQVVIFVIMQISTADHISSQIRFENSTGSSTAIPSIRRA